MPLTQAETEVLRALVAYYLERGVPPSFQDLVDITGRSMSTVRDSTITLADVGYLYRSHKGARCWKPTDAGRAFLAGLEAAA